MLYQQRVVIWCWLDALGHNISKNQLPRSKNSGSLQPKKVHFWNSVWRTPSALWNWPSPISLSFLIWSRWDLVCQSTLGSSWLVPNLIKFSKELAEMWYFAFYYIDYFFIEEEIWLFWTFHFIIQSVFFTTTPHFFHRWLVDGWLLVPTVQVWPHKKALISGEKMLRLLKVFWKTSKTKFYKLPAAKL